MQHVDNLFAPEMYASLLSGWSRDGPNLRMTFVAHRSNHDPAVSPPGSQQAMAVVGRVVMPLEAVAEMVKLLSAALEAASHAPPAPHAPPH